MDIQSYQELLLWRPQPLKALVANGILYEQTKAVLFGDPKLGKSLLAQQLAFCLARGQAFLGFNTMPCKVLYLQSEISRILFKERVEATGKGIGQAIPNGQLYFSTMFGFHLDKDAASTDLAKEVGRLKPDVVILDPKYKLVSSNDENSIIRLTDTIDKLISNFGITVILIDHARKPRMASSGSIVDMGGTELRGPIIEQWADSIIRLQGDLATDSRLMSFELRHAATLMGPKQIRLDRHTLWFREVT